MALVDANTNNPEDIDEGLRILIKDEETSKGARELARELLAVSPLIRKNEG